MRMINADYVLRIIGDQLYGEMSAGDENLYDHKTYDDGLKFCYDLLQNVAKHADDQGRHGHWIRSKEHPLSSFAGSEGYWMCSDCGREISDRSGLLCLYSYCPHCGARMDGETENKS